MDELPSLTTAEVDRIFEEISLYVEGKRKEFDEIPGLLKTMEGKQDFSWFDWLTEPGAIAEVAKNAEVDTKEVLRLLKLSSRGVRRAYLYEREKALEGLLYKVSRFKEDSANREAKSRAGSISPKQKAVMPYVKAYLDDPGSYGNQEAFILDMQDRGIASKRVTERVIAKCKDNKIT